MTMDSTSTAQLCAAHMYGSIVRPNRKVFPTKGQPTRDHIDVQRPTVRADGKLGDLQLRHLKSQLCVPASCEAAERMAYTTV